MHRKTKLKNGLNLITVPVKGTRAMTILAMYPVGSRYETPQLSGASHFVEHMLFKGTATRPVAKDITREIDALGAEYNAFTHKEYTGYYIKIDAAKQEIAFDILSDILFHSVISKEEVEKEKGAIVEELRMYQDNPSMAIDILSDRLVYGTNPLGWDIGGSAETVRAITRDELWEYYQKHYSAKNMVLVVSGNIDRKKVKKMIAYFEERHAPEQATTLSYYKSHYETFSWPAEPVPVSERVMVQERAVDQAQLIINFPGLRHGHPEEYALGILMNILGGTMSSRLFVEVREKRGLAYMVRSGSSAFRDSGLCYVQAGLDPGRMQEALKVVKDELHRIATEKVSLQELHNAQNNIVGRMTLAMEDCGAQAEWCAKDFFFNSGVETPEETMRKYKKVTINQVYKVAHKLLVWDQMRLAAIGPFTKEKVLTLLP